MIEQGRLPAQKVGGRWVIERAALTTDEPVGWAEARSPTIQGDRLGCWASCLSPTYSATWTTWCCSPRTGRTCSKHALRWPTGCTTSALRLNPKRLAVEPTRIAAVFLGYRISQAGIAPSRNLRRRVRLAAARGEESLIRTLRSYRGLLVFP
ncbi:hypothetical protein ACCUM_0064 [Candidatus Accumulibacter phosphatis]|uniref:Uncharacterized protein n=2 Tax=Candidatus Accumulibacter phosphatis TaxID=327160 RepID=A0A5S4ELI5_9PROT|nr:hypothetical protein ACCUM_0064 [Candidatus Accumulibacter phosphatis]